MASDVVLGMIRRDCELCDVRVDSDHPSQVELLPEKHRLRPGQFAPCLRLANQPNTAILG
jgi:hypothetical protein